MMMISCIQFYLFARVTVTMTKLDFTAATEKGPVKEMIIESLAR